MGLFSTIKKKESMEQAIGAYFDLINAYNPRFTTFEGSIYEMELTRAAINSFATHVSKLKPEINGSGNEALERRLQYRPNPLMDTKKYLSRIATVWSVDNTAFIAPLYDSKFNTVGFYPLATEKCAVVDYNGRKYLKYQFDDHNYGAVELEKAGILNQFQYRNELFGESNNCMRPTMELMSVQNQGIIEGVKNSASIRFMAKLAQVLKPADLEAERERFNSTNLGSSNNGGVLLFDQKYSEVKQVESKPFVVDREQMAAIKENVFNYFGTNEHILQNKFTSDEWAAYYEGKIEPFAIELSLVHTNMLFSEREIAFGNNVIFTTNRTQYMSNTEKLNTVTLLFDRGFITHNQGLEVFNMPPVENGDKRYIRREYVETNNLDSEEPKEELDPTPASEGEGGEESKDATAIE